jgi:aspartate aminotransferase
VGQLRYFDEATRGLAFAAFLEDVERAPEGSILVLHTCAHNPTGVDPTPAQWQVVEQAVTRRRHTVLFDTAYQGYASGSLERDAWALRHFVDRGHEVLVCQSFAKNMGLYGERVGTVSVVCGSAASVAAVESRLEKVIRPMYSNPPKHGALVAATILGSPELRAQWLRELVEMSSRILATRKALVAELQRLGTPGTWTHITSQIGMFSYTGLSPAQVEILTRRHHVYLLSSGRISMAGINQGNVVRLAAAIDDAVRSTQPKL